MTGTGNELAVREGYVITPADRAAAAADAGLDSWLIVMKDVVLLAEHICETSFVPKRYRGNAPAVAAAILTGRELALPPMTALRHIQMVEDTPSLSAEYKRARVLSAGHRLDIDEHTTEACQVTGHRKGHQSVTVRFTIQDARKAGLIKDRGAYMTRPRRMLFARACTEVVDALFTDLTNGLATTELIEAGDEEDAPLALDAAPAQPERPRVTAEQARERRPQTVTAVATTVTPDPSPAPAATPSASAATPPQQSAGEAPDPGPAPGDPEYESATYGAKAQFKRILGDDQELWLAYAARILRIAAVAALSDLTLPELRDIVDTLAGCRHRAALEARLTTGEASGEWLARDDLALAIARVRNAHAVPLARYETSADDLAAELIAELAEMRATGVLRDAGEHLCCAHAPDSLAAPELAAIDRITAMLAHRSQREAARILAYVKDYATDQDTPPF